MGGRGKSSGSKSSTYLPIVGKAELESALKQMTKEENAINFLEFPPETINLKGIDFKVFGEAYKSIDNKGNRTFTNTYQSVKQASDGSYPLFDTVVKEIKTKKYTKYTFVTEGINRTKFW